MRDLTEDRNTFKASRLQCARRIWFQVKNECPTLVMASSPRVGTPDPQPTSLVTSARVAKSCGRAQLGLIERQRIED